jgi:exonuclease SbcD
MKILHTADWHLGKRLEQHSRLDEQRAVLREICAIAEREAVDVVLLAGDIFDSANPPVEAQELLYVTLHRLAAGGTRAVIGIAGNHDSPDRIEAPDALARACGITLAGYPDGAMKPFALETGLELTRSDAGFAEFRLPNGERLRLLLTPYANELRLRKAFLGEDEGEKSANLRSLLQEHWANLANRYCDAQGVNMLMAHLFVMRNGGSRPEESDDERSILSIGGASEIYSENLPQGLQYAAFGHLHRSHAADTAPYPMMYSGSPLAYSMSEAEQDKYVLIVEAEAGKPATVRPILLESGKKLVRRTFDTVPAACDWLMQNPDVWVELTLRTPNFLTAAERKSLYDAHAGIVALIPVVTDTGSESAKAAAIDLSQNIETLFATYFEQKHRQPPNEEMLRLFAEILNAEE